MHSGVMALRHETGPLRCGRAAQTAPARTGSEPVR